MNKLSHHRTLKKLLTAAITAAMFFTATAAGAGWGAGAWDPHEACLEEYGFLDRYGPSREDIQRMYRDNWRAMRGYPVYHDGVGPSGP